MKTLPPVTGRVVRTSVEGGRAKALLELEGTSAAVVREMFLTRPAKEFFPGAKTWFEARTREGGQQFLENPLFGVPIMFTQINPTDKGHAKGEFVGLINGEAPLRIWDENGKTFIEELGTQVHPLTPMDLPPWKLAEAMPLFGMFARGMRQATHAVIGAPLAAVHASLIARDNAQTICRTLTEMQRRG